MSSDKVTFKLLEAKLIGTDTVNFRLEDGTNVKIRVEIDKCAIAENFKNPDGSDHYMINPSIKLTILPKSKTFTIPRDKINVPRSPKPLPDNLIR